LSYKIQVGQQTSVLRGLPFAGKEVINLAKTVPGTDKRIDQAFSLKTLRPLFTNFNILHFATHAAFFPGRPEDSFILFGDGERATLRSIEDWSLSGVDLVVLSACESGLGIESSPNNPKPDKLKLGNGTEILGLGYQFQHSGARATIASLWSVDDGGTQSLMSAFYKFLQKGNITKAEALRQAQVLLITGKGDPQAGIKNLNHPHYWAPFITIGNGL
jgi:CHAT domain-containing protein